MDEQKEDYLTVEEVAKKLRVSPVTVYRMARKGLIPAVKFGKAWRISHSELKKLLTPTENR